MTVRVLVADAATLVAEALARSLAAVDGFDVLAERPDGGIELVRAARDLAPDVAVVDYWLPQLDGPAVLQALAAQAPGTRVISLSQWQGYRLLETALDTGAVAFLSKSIGLDVLADAIHRAAAGERQVYRAQSAMSANGVAHREHFYEHVRQHLAMLTPRELEVLQVVAQGHAPKDAARLLAIAPSTYRRHVHNILQKTQARSQIQLVAVARETGFVP